MIMSQAPQEPRQAGWSNLFDCAKIFDTFRMARHTSKVGLALAALVLTVGWGSLLDAIWVRSESGVPANAIELYQAGREYPPAASDTESAPETVSGEAMPAAGETASHEHGVFQLYSRNLRLQTVRLTRAVIPTEGLGGLMSDVTGSIGAVARSTIWVARRHPVFAILFFPGILLIWSVFGGMICRIAALQFARDELIGIRDAFDFVRRRLWGGFFLAPLAPIIGVLALGILLALGGLFLSIPFLGNTLGALFFFLAVLAGLAIAVLSVGLVGGGSLLWPAIAVEGTTSFDAFSTSFHYVYTRPWRSAWYGVVALAYGSVCWLVIGFFARLTLWATHAFVGLGTVASRTVAGGAEISKLDALWKLDGLFGPFHGYESSAVSGLDYLGVGLIGLWVYLLIAVVWAVLVSFYFCASTVIYFLLRRAVDLTDYEQVEDVEEYEEDVRREEAPSTAPAATQAVESQPTTPVAAAPEAPPPGPSAPPKSPRPDTSEPVVPGAAPPDQPKPAAPTESTPDADRPGPGS
jgi:hypothetical protein